MPELKQSISGIAGTTITVAVLFMAPSIYAENDDAALNPQKLAECAQRVQTLRERSATLNKHSRQLDERRRALAAQRERLNESDEAADSDEQRAWARYNSRAATFNDDMAQFRRAVADINKIKREYDRQCANRSYRQSDFENLPESARKAMQAGLSDVRVPYTADQKPQR